jgi:hypothetical protein
MVASVTAEIKLQVDKIEVLSPTVVPLQNEIAALTASSNSLQAEIASMKAQVASNNTDKNAKEDTISNTSNDIMILKDTIAQKKAEIDPLPGQIDVSCFSLCLLFSEVHVAEICLRWHITSLLLFFLSNSSLFQECVEETERLEGLVADYQVRLVSAFTVQ